MTTEVKKTSRITLRTGFGPQPLSTKSTQPAYGFGSSVREASLRQYLSADHAKVMSGNNSQGPIYRVLSAMGHQSESTYKTAPINSFGTEPRLPKPPNRQVPGPGTYKVPSTAYGSQVVSAVSTAPRIVFGSSTRDQAIKVYQEDADKAFFGLGSPGPCAYKTTSMLGRQVLSNKESAGAAKMGKSDRFKYDHVRRALEIPGAGQYSQTVAVGRQSLSNKRTMPAAKFGTSTRDRMKKVFISPEHEKGTYGENSPGPVTAEMHSSIGRQTLSRKATKPSWGFGHAERKTVQVSNTPGPGAYWA